MNKKLTLALAAVALISASSFTVLTDCETCEQLTNGTTWTISNYDGKGKLNSHVDYKVTKITPGLGATNADIAASFFDSKGDANGSSDYTISCEDGNYEMDMRHFVTPEMKKGGKNMDFNVTGDMLEYPSDMKAGDALSGGTMTVKMVNKNDEVVSTTTVVFKDRKCQQTEKKTTSAGTWDCYKITYTAELSIEAAGIDLPMKSRTCTEWFSFKVGAVRSESFKEGKLDSYSELTAFKKGS